MKRSWTCQIGYVDETESPEGADLPMRRAVEAAFKKLFGRDDNVCSSGWGSTEPAGASLPPADVQFCPVCDVAKALHPWPEDHPTAYDCKVATEKAGLLGRISEPFVKRR